MRYEITTLVSKSPVLQVLNALVLRVPAQGVSKSSSRSPPGVATLPMDSGPEYRCIILFTLAHIKRSEIVKPIFHQNAKYLASGTFASPNAKDSTSASPNARIPTCWYILR